MKPDSRLARILDAGTFAVTAELGPPKGPSRKAIQRKVKLLAGCADAVNLTDNQTAVVRMSSIAAAAIVIQEGMEPVVQMVCRDRNRIAIQSDIIGAAALGVKNLLCLSGDHQLFGNQPGARNVFDIDSIQLLAIVRRMRDENRIWGVDAPFKGDLPIFIGAAANPFAEPFEYRPLRLKKKVDAGADFIQTQAIFDIGIFRQWMAAVRDLGLHERCHILAGLTPLKSARMARHMAENVSGVILPERLLKRMESAPEAEAGEEGIRICLELIAELREIEGVHGIHLMAIDWEERVSEIVERAGLLPRPKEV